MLLQHAGLRSLWPVVLFIPWYLIGLAYLIGALRHRKEVRSAHSRAG